MPNAFAEVRLLIADKRYCIIENVLLAPDFRGSCFNNQKRESPSLFYCTKNRGTGTPFNVYYHDSSGMSTMFFAFFSFSIFFCLAAALLHAPTGIRTRSVPFGNPTVLSRQPVPFGYERLSALGGIRTLKPPVLSRIHIPFWYKGMYSWRSSNLQVKRRHPDLNRDISMRITHGLANRCLTC